MKKIALASALATAALTLAPTTAFAKNEKVEGKVTSILYSCNMDFRATGKSIYIGLGWSDIKGHGTISCYDLLHGTTEVLPIKVKAKGPGAGIGVTGLVLSGAVAGVGVEKGPEDLIGHYAAVRGNAAVGVGAGAAAGLRVSKGGITVDVSVQAETGLGAGIDLLWLKIERDGDSKVEPAVVATQPPAAPAPEAAKPEVKQEAEATVSATTSEAQAEVVTEDAARPAPAAAPAAPTKAAATTAATATATTTSAVATASAKTNIVYLQEGQPLQILDAKGKVIQTIYLKQK